MEHIHTNMLLVLKFTSGVTGPFRILVSRCVWRRIWRWLSSGLLQCVVSYKFTDVSDELHYTSHHSSPWWWCQWASLKRHSLPARLREAQKASHYRLVLLSLLKKCASRRTRIDKSHQMIWRSHCNRKGACAVKFINNIKPFFSLLTFLKEEANMRSPRAPPPTRFHFFLNKWPVLTWF
jgi:hypothetical protein